MHDSILFFGKNNYINKKMQIILTEQKHMFVGEECLFAINCWFRTSDPHLLYDIDSKKRINNSQSIFIGDHVWFGQDVLTLKNSKIGSGCIVAARGVVSGKVLNSNTIYGGNPVRCIKENVFHLKKSVRKYKKDHDRGDFFSH